MKTKIYILVLSLAPLILSGCSNNNSSMYVVEKQQESTEETLPNGYGNIEAQVDPDADIDKQLGTKHVNLIDGIPYAELDGAENNNDNNNNKVTESKPDTSRIDSIKDAISNKNKSEETEEKAEEQPKSKNVVNNFINAANDLNMLTSTVTREQIEDVTEQSGIAMLNNQDNFIEMALAVDKDTGSSYVIATYESESDLSKAFELNKNTLESKIENLEIIDNSEDYYWASYDIDDSTVDNEILINEINGEYYLLLCMKLSDADSYLETINNEL